MTNEQSTPLLVGPRRFELCALTKGMEDKFLDIPINDLIGDIAHLFTDYLRARWKCGKDVAFRPSGNQETEVCWKVVVGDLVRHSL